MVFMGFTLLLREITYQELTINYINPEFHMLHWPFFASVVILGIAIMSLVCSLFSEPGYVTKMTLANSNNIIDKIS